MNRYPALRLMAHAASKGATPFDCHGLAPSTARDRYLRRSNLRFGQLPTLVIDLRSSLLDYYSMDIGLIAKSARRNSHIQVLPSDGYAE